MINLDLSEIKTNYYFKENIIKENGRYINTICFASTACYNPNVDYVDKDDE